MQIVLSGQPQLGKILLRPSLVQLRQRVSTFCRLEPLAPEESASYISHRLTVAGYEGPPLFTADALTGIANASEGIPRNINNLCFNALSLCQALRKKRVDRTVLAEVLHDLHPVTHESTAQDDEDHSVHIAVNAPESRKRPNWLSRMRIPALATGLLISICGAFWMADVFSAGHRPNQQHVLSPQAAPDNSAPPTDVIEVTVSPKQTISEISILNLGTFNDEILRQIQELNPGLENPNRISPGEKLVLPSRQRLQRHK